MQKNIGNIERIARLVVGIALIIWAIAGGPLWAWAGVLLLATGLLRWCPAHMLFGARSCSVKK
ncbi:YgaP family membrane protein [Azotobacter salinestris]|uniref:YgaP family membrane protein n=1 Tax=Azotobacter salinestris TaxID=69964 RepID=UPI0032DFE28A